MRRTMIMMVGVLVAASTATVAWAGGASHQTSEVVWHPQQAALGRAGLVDGASATLVRNDTGISYRVSTERLEPGNAYTLWLVVINNPDACHTTPCEAEDLFNPATRSQISYAAGTVAGRSGKGTLAGHVDVGPLSGWLPDRSLEGAHGPDVALVVNEHGPMLAEFMPSMIKSYRGGCSDDSPFPPFPASALADGEVGPNLCWLYQLAYFVGS